MQLGKNLQSGKSRIQFRGKRRKKNGGFTLIEVLVAMVILAIISVPIISAFVSSSTINLKARRQEHANAVGQKISENYKSLSLTKLLDTVDNSNIQVATSSLTGQKIYRFNMGSYDASGNPYGAASNGDEFFVQVELNPDDFADKLDAEEASKDNPNNNINSYNMPSFSELKSDQTFPIMTQVYEHDAEAASYGVPIERVYRKVDVYVTITDKVPGTINVNQTAEGYRIYTQSVSVEVSYCEWGGGTLKTYSYDMGSCTIRGNVEEDQYRNVYLFYNPFDKFRSDASPEKSRDVVTFHVNDGDITNMKFNAAMDKDNTPIKDKKINLYLVEQEVKNVHNSSITVKLQTANVSLRSGSDYNVTGQELAAKTIGIGVHDAINLLTNASCIQTYKPSVLLEQDKTFNNATNTLTQEIDPNTEIKYLYNMVVKVWINESPGSTDPYLTLLSTKENAHEAKESAHEEK